MQLKTVLDNADGQLARLSGRVTLLGRYLDSECDLLVDAALFAALGWYAGAPARARAASSRSRRCSASTSTSSGSCRGAAAAAAGARTGRRVVLGRVYALVYGWQDRLVERFVDGGCERIRASRSAYHDLTTVGCSPTWECRRSSRAFGVCIALGHPLAFVWLLVGRARARRAPARAARDA